MERPPCGRWNRSSCSPGAENLASIAPDAADCFAGGWVVPWVGPEPLLKGDGVRRLLFCLVLWFVLALCALAQLPRPWVWVFALAVPGVLLSAFQQRSSRTWRRAGVVVASLCLGLAAAELGLAMPGVLEGVADSATLPEQVCRRVGLPAHSMSFHGWGPHQMLALLEAEEEKPVVAGRSPS